MKKYEVTVTLAKTWKEEIEAESIVAAQELVEEYKEELLSECSYNRHLDNYNVETSITEKGKK